MEIVKISLENEMDLILAHKRSMKLAELCGLSVLIQTSFATAVSEIARCVIGDENDTPQLTLEIVAPNPKKKEMVAVITAACDFQKHHSAAIRYASRLSGSMKVEKSGSRYQVRFTQTISFPGLINNQKIESFVNYFKTELPLSPYEELRKKNIQLLEMSEKLRVSENQYRSLTETLPLMMFTTNAGGYLNHSNKWLKDYFKILEVPAGKIDWQSFLHAADASGIRAEWERAQQNRTVFRAQSKLKSRAGEEPLWHLITLMPVRDDNDQLGGWTGFFVDIHAQKLVEETLKDNKELKVAQKMLLASQAKLESKISELNRSNHDLEQFAYIASHDLQEPLRKIRNFGDLMGRNLADQKMASKYLEKIDHASHRMQALIRDVLNYSRLSTGENIFEKCSLEQIISSVRVDMELLLEEKKAKVITSTLPEISGIPQQLYQLFYNLISNAVKFNNGEPEIRISGRALSSTEIAKTPSLHNAVKYYEITVADNGIGFDDKYSRQVFTIFKRLHTRDSYSGTGIGLALCKKIVENHHGEISVASKVGEGTTFSILLPEE